MVFGIVLLYCPICGAQIRYNDRAAQPWHHRVFGVLCGEACFHMAECKYARMILHELIRSLELSF